MLLAGSTAIAAPNQRLCRDFFDVKKIEAAAATVQTVDFVEILELIAQYDTTRQMIRGASNNPIALLVGPKNSGKTYIAERLRHDLNIPLWNIHFSGQDWDSFWEQFQKNVEEQIFLSRRPPHLRRKSDISAIVLIDDILDQPPEFLHRLFVNLSQPQFKGIMILAAGRFDFPERRWSHIETARDILIRTGMPAGLVIGVHSIFYVTQNQPRTLIGQ